MANLKNEKLSTIKKDQVQSLWRVGMTRSQICDFFHVTPNTLQTFCKKEFGKKFEEVKAENSVFLQPNVMTNLVKLSQRNASAAIFLAKAVCGLSDQTVTVANEEANESFANALKTASRSIGNLSNLASVPDQEEEEDE